MNETRSIDSLVNWDKNPRTLKEVDFARLKTQIEKLGQYKPLIITNDGVVLGGNMRLRAYKEMGIKDVWVSVVNAPDDKTRLEYALSDNDRVGSYDEQQLAELVAGVPDLDLGVYKVDLGEPIDLQALLDKFGPTPEIEEDIAPEPPVEAKSKLGEIYQLGRHRLMCGDATKIEDVEQLIHGSAVDLVLTDPPYGISIVGDTGHVGAGNIAKIGTYSQVINDETTDTARDAYGLFETLNIPKMVIWGGNYFADFLPAKACWIVWDKRGDMPSNNFADCELAWTNQTSPARVYKQVWNGMIREGESDKRVHPTQKPVNLLARIINDFDGHNILDVFGGSGSTLIAAQQTGRTCYMMELDPRYVDVIIARYESLTGDKAQLLEG